MVICAVICLLIYKGVHEISSLVSLSGSIRDSQLIFNRQDKVEATVQYQVRNNTCVFKQKEL